MIFALEIKDLDTYLLKKFDDKLTYMNLESIYKLYAKDDVYKAWFYQYEETTKIDIIAVSFNPEPNKIIHIMDFNVVLKDAMSFDLNSNSKPITLKNIDDTNFSHKPYKDLSVEEISSDKACNGNLQNHDLDSMLEKISRFGLNKLTRGEMKYLNSLK